MTQLSVQEQASGHCQKENAHLYANNCTLH